MGMTVITVLHFTEVVQLLATSCDFHVAVFAKQLTHASSVLPGELLRSMVHQLGPGTPTNTSQVSNQYAKPYPYQSRGWYVISWVVAPRTGPYLGYLSKH